MDEDKNLKNRLHQMDIPDPSPDLVANILHQTRPSMEVRKSLFDEIRSFLILPNPNYAFAAALVCGIALGLFTNDTWLLENAGSSDWDIINEVLYDEDIL